MRKFIFWHNRYIITIICKANNIRPQISHPNRHSGSVVLGGLPLHKTRCEAPQKTTNGGRSREVTKSSGCGGRRPKGLMKRVDADKKIYLLGGIGSFYHYRLRFRTATHNSQTSHPRRNKLKVVLGGVINKKIGGNLSIAAYLGGSPLLNY